jgi:hypothetical protein
VLYRSLVFELEWPYGYFGSNQDESQFFFFFFMEMLL